MEELKILDNPELIMELASDPEKAKAREEKRKKQFEGLVSLIEKSFDHHDKNKSGTLDQEESALFFKHFVSENAEFTKAITEFAAMTAFNSSLKMLQECAKMMGARFHEMKKEAEEQVKVQIAELKKHIDDMVKDYHNNKEARDRAAFKVIDVNNDCQLQKTEFVPALTPETQKHADLMRALGFDAASAARPLVSAG